MMTDELKPDLLPCPFCGSLATMTKRGGLYRVECVERFGICQINMRTHHAATQKQAAAQWNARTTGEDELAGRDRRIAELERERDEANEQIEALEVKAHDLRLVLDGVAKERNELRELLREAADYLEEQPYWADELHICKRIRQIIEQDSGESE